MDIKNQAENYGLIAILLHWLMAILVIVLLVSGVYMVGLGYYDPWYNTAPWWHKSLGLLVFILLIIKLYWRLTNIRPAPLKSYKTWEVKISSTLHWSTYVLLLIICISGYFFTTAKGVDIAFFDYFKVPAMGSLTTSSSEIAGKIHRLISYLLAILVILHMMAALKHHFYDKDITLKRMLGFKNKESIK